MLTFPKILARALLIAVGAMLGDGALSLGLTLVGFNFIETIGDLILVEVAVLFLVAGLIDFSSSVGAVQFRKVLLRSKQQYSRQVHNEAQGKALVLLLAGIFLFVMLIAVAVLIIY